MKTKKIKGVCEHCNKEFDISKNHKCRHNIFECRCVYCDIVGYSLTVILISSAVFALLTVIYVVTKAINNILS
jgi:hypothetical protein